MSFFNKFWRLYNPHCISQELLTIVITNPVWNYLLAAWPFSYSAGYTVPHYCAWLPGSFWPFPRKFPFLPYPGVVVVPLPVPYLPRRTLVAAVVAVVAPVPPAVAGLAAADPVDPVAGLRSVLPGSGTALTARSVDSKTAKVSRHRRRSSDCRGDRFFAHPPGLLRWRRPVTIGLSRPCVFPGWHGPRRVLRVRGAGRPIRQRLP